MIDDQAEVRGIRIVTDPRDPSGDRDEAYLLRNFLNSRFGRDGWQCQDLAAEEGEEWKWHDKPLKYSDPRAVISPPFGIRHCGHPRNEELDQNRKGQQR